jgi:hypothetical protein
MMIFFPAILFLLPLLTARAAAHGPPDVVIPSDLPPWGVALVAKMGKMEDMISSMQTTMNTQSWTIQGHSARIQELEAARRQQPGSGPTMTAGRRLQAAPTAGRVVRIHSTSVDIPEGPGRQLSGNHGGGHRRTQSPSCGPTRLQSVNTECCNGPLDDCTGGAPRTCNPGCAATFLPFWTDCSVTLHLQTTPLYQSTVALCQASGASSSGTGASVVHEFQLVCTDGSASCVPSCDASLHGDLLLLAVNGQDSKYSCELRNGLFSWVGPAADGGYIGSDVATFVSAVVSGAAGLFVLTMQASSLISTLLTIEPGQTVSISGNFSSPIAWGTGGFSIMQHGNLALSQVTLNGPITLAAGARLQLSNVTLQNFACLTVEQGSNVILPAGQTRPPACAVCAAIPHCHTRECTPAGVSVCTRCDAGYYAFHRTSHAVNPAGSCVEDSATSSSAGLTPTSTGSFTFTFSGALPSDLISGNVTLTSAQGDVADTTIVSLTGTGTELLGASLTINAAQLSLAQLQLAVPSTTISNGGRLSLRSVSGSLTQFTVSDSTFNHDESSFYLVGAVSFANAGTISLSDANFGPATSLSVSRGTVCDITASGTTTSTDVSSLNGLEVMNASFSLAVASALLLGGQVRFDNAGTVSLTGTQFSTVGPLTVSGGTACRLTNTLLPGTRFLFDTGSSLTLLAVTLSDNLGLGALSGNITVDAGGLFVAQPLSLAAAVLPGNPQCSQPYTTLNDPWRTADPLNGLPGYCDHSDCNGALYSTSYPFTGVGGAHDAWGQMQGGWYRFTGTGGDALPLTPPTGNGCSSSVRGGWLSGWDSPTCRVRADCAWNTGTDTIDTQCLSTDGGQGYQNSCIPPQAYDGAGRYPDPNEGVVAMTVCFVSAQYSGSGRDRPCSRYVTVGVLQCEGFLLWRLPYTPNCDTVYCTAPSAPPNAIQTPTPTPTPTLTNAVFAVTSGPCTLLQGGQCVGRPNGYSGHESCSITALVASTTLSCPVFNTERSYDQLTIAGIGVYSGTSCPQGVSVTPSTTISWMSDGSISGNGWEICGSGEHGK